MASDSNFLKIIKFRNVYDIVDVEWLEDCLSEDDIELPAGEEFVADDGDLESADVLHAANEDDEWSDLALEEVFGPAPLR